MLVSTAANVKIDPSTGPMHGVHPKPKAKPTNTGPKIPIFFSECILFSKFKKLMFITPNIWSEKIIIITPAKILSSLELLSNNFPR